MFCFTGTTDCMDYEECNKLPDDVCSNPTYRRIAETSCRKFCKLCTGELNRPVHQCKRLYMIYLRCASAPTIFQLKKQSHNFPPIICLSNIYEWMNKLIYLFILNFITVALAPTKPVVTGTTEAMMVPTKAPVSESATGDQTDQATTEAISMEPSQAGSEQPSSEVVSMPTKPAASVATTTSKEEYFVVFIYVWCRYIVVRVL